MAQATVLSITGNAVVVAADGTTRPLKVGDIIRPGETIRTAAGARVELMMEDGQVVAMGPQQALRVDEAMAQTDATPTAADAGVQPGSIDQILQVLEQGGDLTEELEAAAAGAGGGAGGDGSDFVRLLRVVEGVDPLAYEYGPNALGSIEEPLLSAAQPINTPPEPEPQIVYTFKLFAVVQGEGGPQYVSAKTLGEPGDNTGFPSTGQ
ncbi:retention module-containing protein, partial [Tepidicella xavieri]|uniref:retention module-containing protein n=1 Tax=Tepidicella xavieri TaxID=360241 RepID=UPI0013DE0D9D